ncbi:MAG: COG4315 family predicted lipoprotein [Cellvibrionaceae bacterium]
MKKLTQSLMLVAATTFLASATAYAGGQTLTNKAGMTLYTFDKDKDGVSVCYGPCAEKWPPFIAAADAKVKKGWGVTARKDGSKQWTFNNQPLYTWVGDTKAGDKNGDGVGGVWHVAEKMKAKSASKKGGYGKSYYSSSTDY